jgi:hypothetical protein
VEELKAARWTGSPRTDADGQCEFRYQPQGWGRAYQFVALRYQKKPKPKKLNEPEQYQLATFDYSGRKPVRSPCSRQRSDSKPSACIKFYARLVEA